MTTQDQSQEKRIAGYKAADYVKDGMVVGLGTGSTVYYFLEALKDRVKAGLQIKGIPTSITTKELAMKWGIPLTTLGQHPELDLTVDGADEVDDSFNLIKGGGGALVREKIIAASSRKEVIISDSSKYVERLGSFPLPVEVVQYGHEATRLKLEELGTEVVLRRREGKPFVTDNGNYIYDCAFGVIQDPPGLEKTLNLIPGVVECGLFIGLTDLVIIGRGDKLEILEK